MGKLETKLSQFWTNIQGTLFPFLEEELDSLTKKQQQLITILEVVRIEQYIPDYRWYEGRPRKNRCAIARSFIAKTVYNMSTTRALWDRLHSDKGLRRICGWENKNHIPSESTFSRAFADFAETKLPQKVHEALIEGVYEETETIIMHNNRDATAIEGREKPLVKDKKSEGLSDNKKASRKRGRPKKGAEKPPKEPSRLEKQQSMSLKEMLEDLPKECNIGTKKNSKGHSEHWIGYKLHVDTADGCIPISAILT